MRPLGPGKRNAIPLVAIVLIASCVATPDYSPRAPVHPSVERSPPSSPSLEPSPSGEVTSAPSVPATIPPSPSGSGLPAITRAVSTVADAAPLDRFASVAKNGMRLRIALQRSPMPAGEWTSVVTEVTNVGREPLTWMSDGCEMPGEVWGVMEDVTWRPGVEQLDVARRFKDRALGIAFRDDPTLHPTVRFVTEDKVGDGSTGCADIGLPHVVEPGQTLRRTLIWDGYANSRWGPAPSGSVTITALFHSFGPEGGEARGKLELQHETRVINGIDATWLSPPEIVDAALADAEFHAYIVEQDRLCKCGLGNGREEILRYRPELGVWEVGLLIWHDFPEPRVQVVLVDPFTGAIRDRVHRPWDRERDGFPP